MWPAIALSAAAVCIGDGLSPLLALALAAGHTAGPVGAAWGLRRLGLHHALDRREDVWHLCLIGVAAATLFAATNAALCLFVSGTVGPVRLPAVWLHGWLGDAVGTLLLAVPLLTLSRSMLNRAFSEWHGLPHDRQFHQGSLRSLALGRLKLGAADRTHAVTIAIQRGILHLDS